MKNKKNKGGRPRKNKYDALRMQRMYEYIHSKDLTNLGFKNISDYEIAKRMQIVLDVFFKIYVSLEGLKSWLHQIKKGNKASISPMHLWAFIYTLSKRDFYESIEIYKNCEKRKDILINFKFPALDTRLMNNICTILHYAVNIDFLSLHDFVKRGKKTLERKGYNLYSVVFNTSDEWFIPKTSILGGYDLAIDIAELLNFDHIKVIEMIVEKVLNICRGNITKYTYFEATKAIYLSFRDYGYRIGESTLHKIMQIFMGYITGGFHPYMTGNNKKGL